MKFLSLFLKVRHLYYSVSSTRDRRHLVFSVIISQGERSENEMPGMSSIENEITSGNKIFVLTRGRGRRRERKRKKSLALGENDTEITTFVMWRKNSLVNHARIFPSSSVFP